MPPPLTQPMYIRFNTKQEAKQLSSDFWVRLLGRPVIPGDTEFMFRTLECKDGAHDYVELVEPLFSQIWPKLTPQEQNFLDANMVPASNVQVQDCIASLSTGP